MNQSHYLKSFVGGGVGRINLRGNSLCARKGVHGYERMQQK